MRVAAMRAPAIQEYSKLKEKRSQQVPYHRQYRRLPAERMDCSEKLSLNVSPSRESPHHRRCTLDLTDSASLSSLLMPHIERHPDHRYFCSLMGEARLGSNGSLRSTKIESRGWDYGSWAPCLTRSSQYQRLKQVKDQRGQVDDREPAGFDLDLNL